MGTRASNDRRRDERRVSRFLASFGTRWSDLNPFDRSDRGDDSFEKGWRRVVRVRAAVVLAVLACWGVFLQARLVQLQVVRHEYYKERAIAQQQDAIEIEPVRGSVVDRNGRLLAYSVDAEGIGIHPRLVRDKPHTVAALCGALGDCTKDQRASLQKLLTSRRTFFYVRRARTLAPEQVDRVKSLNLPGVVAEHDSRRYYPGRELAAHALGYVSVDNKGLGGIEHAYDKSMKGAAGKSLVQVDANGTRINTLVQGDPVPGSTLELSLDLDFQHIVERELVAGIEATGAKAGTAIVMNPHTGQILAFANYPTFNPNEAWLADPNALKNRATQDIYEPGSTFKIVTAAAALEEHVVQPSEIIQTGPGYITFPGRKPIRDTHAYGALSFEDVVVNSSNVGTIKVALRLGADRLARYVHRFGFGQRLAPDFIGASAGIWAPQGLNDSGLASVSIGYQIGVTPLQMVTAVSAIANGGLLMEPHILSAVVQNGQRQPVEPKVIRRVIEPSTAATITAMLEGVVSRGTAKAGKVDGFMAAGKTGTASKVIDGGYSKSDYNASFVGFVPSRRPEYTILVVIDSPKKGSYYGGAVAAPIFKRIAEGLLLKAGVMPTTNPEPSLIIRADEPMPSPLPIRRASLLPASVTIDGPALMPDVRGLGAREALAVLHGAGLYVRVNGNGFVQRQSPAPGAPIESGAWGSLELARQVPQGDQLP